MPQDIIKDGFILFAGPFDLNDRDDKNSLGGMIFRYRRSGIAFKLTRRTKTNPGIYLWRTLDGYKKGESAEAAGKVKTVSGPRVSNNHKGFQTGSGNPNARHKPEKGAVALHGRKGQYQVKSKP